MKFNIKPEYCKFVIDEKNKVVVCIFENSQYLFLDFIDENCKLNVFGLWGYENKKFREKLFMPNRFVGRATCGKDDEFNVETGKTIAFSRMKDNINKSFFKRANTFFNQVDRWVDEAAETVNILGEKLKINTEHRHKLIDSMLGEK